MSGDDDKTCLGATLSVFFNEVLCEGCKGGKSERWVFGEETDVCVFGER